MRIKLLIAINSIKSVNAKTILNEMKIKYDQRLN